MTFIIKKHTLLITLLVLLIFSCTKSSKIEDNLINLKWNKAYTKDNFENHKAGVKWALAFLGSKIAMDTSYKGMTYKDNVITVDVNCIGLSKKAVVALKNINRSIKNSGEYKKKGNIDIGRYLALTIGNSEQYYKIVDVPLSVFDFENIYSFSPISAHINNSSVSKINREIKYSITEKNHKRAFVSKEVDTINKTVREYESVEIMENGLSRFAVYNSEGKLKQAGSLDVTSAGKPGKCMWCHESVIQPLFRSQKVLKNYMPPQQFLDSLITFNRLLFEYQNKIWQDSLLVNRKHHTNMELSYITFMEPSIEQLANEWEMSIEAVKKKVAHLVPHTHEEFDFLGDKLYHRKDIDTLGPYTIINVPKSIRELSVH